MTDLQVRTDPSQPDEDADVLLDWFDEKAASTVRSNPEFLTGLTPSLVAGDLLRLGGAVYCTDKIVKRSSTADSWTRELRLQVPVSNVPLWDAAKSELVKALSFLSGDRWALDFVPDAAARATAQPLLSEYEGVSLFSGGLDSLAGVIDLLEVGMRLVLVGHHDSPLTDAKQTALFEALR
jgi:hypothetical protein